MNHSERTEAWNEAKKQDVAQRKLAWERHKTEQSGVSGQVLDDQRIQNEADRIASTLQNLTAHNSPRKTHFIVRVAEDVTSQGQSRRDGAPAGCGTEPCPRQPLF